MAKEIERKFIVQDTSWRSLTQGTKYRQGYLNSTKERTVRVRIIGEKGYIAIKGITRGATRLEYEYEIPMAEAEVMLDELCERPVIEKKRYKIEYNRLIWEVDEFFGENQGLIVAEVELESENQEFVKPEWIGEEVTGDARYFNANLIHHPYRKWRDKTKGRKESSH